MQHLPPSLEGQTVGVFIWSTTPTGYTWHVYIQTEDGSIYNLGAITRSGVYPSTFENDLGSVLVEVQVPYISSQGYLIIIWLTES